VTVAEAATNNPDAGSTGAPGRAVGAGLRKGRTDTRGGPHTARRCRSRARSGRSTRKGRAPSRDIEEALIRPDAVRTSVRVLMDQQQAAAPSGAAPLRPIYDDSEWPIFIARMPAHRLSPDDFHAHLDALREPFRRGQPFGVLIVMGEHPPLWPTQRKAAADAIKSDSLRHPGLLRAKAVVIRSTVERGVVTAVSWMAKPPYPLAAFEAEAAAKAWLLVELGRPRPATQLSSR